MSDQEIDKLIGDLIDKKRQRLVDADGDEFFGFCGMKCYLPRKDPVAEGRTEAALRRFRARLKQADADKSNVAPIAHARAARGDGSPEQSEAMSLRDYFAALAMQAIMKMPFEECGMDAYLHEALVARGAYGYADAMLAERIKPAVAPAEVGK